ncbi:hypothetical protein FACS1894200_01730 [Spirochaetia bacterium]|nr:hypothetical protein FACS1894200_01730 [Spirochaetia bacterium]
MLSGNKRVFERGGLCLCFSHDLAHSLGEEDLSGLAVDFGHLCYKRLDFLREGSRIDADAFHERPANAVFLL